MTRILRISGTPPTFIFGWFPRGNRRVFSLLLAATLVLQNLQGAPEAVRNFTVGQKWEGVYVIVPRVYKLELTVVSVGAPAVQSPGETPSVSAARPDRHSPRRDRNARRADPVVTEAPRLEGVPIQFELSYLQYKFANGPYKTDQVSGTAQFIGEYDPLSATLHLKPVNVQKKVSYPLELVELSAVVAENPRGIVGLPGRRNRGDPVLILSSPEDAPRLGQTFAAELTDQRFPRATPGGPEPAKLREWVKTVQDEFKKTEVRYFGSGNLMLNYPMLFEDRYFEKYFGKTYDRLSHRERGGISARIASIPGDVAHQEDEMLHEARYFFSEGDSAASTLTTVLAMRIQRRWYLERIEAVKNQRPTLTPDHASDSLARKVVSFENDLLPSDRQFASAIDFVKRPAAGALLPKEIEQIGMVQPLSTCILALEDRRHQLAELYRLAPPEIVAQSEARALELYQQKVGLWLASGPDVIKTLGNGLAAVERGAAYYRLLDKIAKGTNHGSEMAERVELLTARRRADFSAAIPEMKERINRWTTVDEAVAAIYRWVALPSDRNLPEVGQLLDLISRRDLKNTINPAGDFPWATAILVGVVGGSVALGDQDAPYGREYNGVPTPPPSWMTPEMIKARSAKDAERMQEMIQVTLKYDEEKRRVEIQRALEAALPLP